MTNVRKRISELTALTSASLDTTLVGVDGGTTYKIELDTLADAVTSRVNILDRDRLNSLESVTSSFETKGRSVISSSAQITTLGFISTSVDISYLNSFTSSQNTLNIAFTNGISGRLTTSSFNDFSSSVNQRILDATNEQSFNGLISGSSQLTSSYDSRYVLSGSITQTTWDNIANKPSGIVSQSTDLSSLNSFTSSQNTLNTAFQNGVNARLQTSSFNDYTASQSTSSLVNRLNAIENVSGSWITESETGSFLTSLNGAISSSTQLTASFDTRYTLSGSVSSTPVGTISGSSQLTASFDSRYSLSGSILTSFSSSVDNRLDTLEASIITGSINYTQVLGNRRTGITSVGTSIISGSITTTGNPVQIMVTGDANPITTAWCRLQIFRDGNGIGNIIQVENSSNLNVPYCLNVIDTPPAGTYTYSMRTVDTMSGTFDFGEFNGPLLTAVELKSNTQLPSGLISGSSQLPSGIISGSSQLTSSYDTRYTLSGSVSAVPSGTISGSSQLTASLDTRYAASGSIGGAAPAGTVSGSSQLTSSLDLRYLVTGSVTSSILQLNTFTASNANTSLNTFTSSLNIWSSSLATTGSNSFNGNQTITGSLNVSSIAVVSSSFTANSSSLTLNSGSNLYVQNNGLVEITGSLVASGSTIRLMTTTLQIGTGSGDEGGEILLAKSATNNSLTGSGITIDSYQNRLRIFEQGGNARGVYIDLTKTPDGNAGELMWKASGIVNAGTFVTLDNIKAQLPTSGNRGLSLATVSGTVSGYISGHYQGLAGSSSGTSSTTSLSTTATSSMFNWNFTNQGDMSTYILRDDTNNRVYRIILIIGGSYNNNFISIERLH